MIREVAFESTRWGFTLVEILVSVVLTAVLSLLVYGAVQVARDTQAQIAGERQALQSAMTMRLLLETALTGAQTSLLAHDTVFVLESAVNSRGRPADRLTFTTSGNLPPLTPGTDWIVTLAPNPDGLDLIGTPRGIRTPSRLLARLPGVNGLAVRARHTQIGGGWSQEWNLPSVLPEAVELTYWTDSSPVGIPLVVPLALGRIY
jgi:prepilin-type N-terminal cleavage/methylation domain-containing protein